MARVDITSYQGFIIVTMPFDEDAKEELKTKFNAKWNPEDKAWMIDEDDYTQEQVIKELRIHFPRDI